MLTLVHVECPTYVPIAMNLIVCLGIVSRNPDMNPHENPSNGSGNTGGKVYWSSCEVPFIVDPTHPG